MFRLSDTERSAEVRRGTIVWRVEQFADGSRRITATDDGVPVAIYPVHQSERLEDVQGLPDYVLQAAEEARIARVRRGPLCDADKALLADAGLAAPVQPVVKLYATDSDGVQHLVLLVYADDSALRGEIVYEHWRDALDAVDGVARAVALCPEGVDLAADIERYIKEVEASA